MTAKIKTIRSSWWEGYGYRLDCQPYLAGSLETKIILENLRHRKDRLWEVTAGHDGGIYNGPQFVRRYVELPEFGVPFITSGSMQLSDLSQLPLLSKKDAYSPKLRYLELKTGMSLISCSGTIGKMAYVRQEMEGIWSSQDVLKVAPDPDKIPPGYIYAFLSSKFGVPLIASGTYGAIIQHLEPEHIANIPVPRLDSKTEWEIHDLVEKAAELRTESSKYRKETVLRFLQLFGTSDIATTPSCDQPIYSEVPGSALRMRMDSFYYAPVNLAARDIFDQAGNKHGSKSLGDVADIFIPEIFKRQYSDDPEYGYPYLTGADVFSLTPSSNQYLLKQVAEGNGLLLTAGMILVHEAGSLSGLIGHSVMVGETLDGFACTNKMIRIVPQDDIDRGYIYAALASEYGVRLIKREAAGSAIPHIEKNRISNIHIPWPMKPHRREVAEAAIRSRELLDEANAIEREAQGIINSEIEK
jgi:type I restriction enzyme, S subunit